MSGFPINRTNSIRCMVEGPGHTMLVGTIEGLITFSSDFSDYENIRFYLNLPRPQAADGLCSADVMSVLRTTDETIYCYCYGGGLCKLVSSNLLSDELRFRSFGKETSPLARALIEDKNHNIWIGSETDITLFDVHDQTFESFGETFFNRSFNYSECLPVADRQGDILMGTEGGMLVFSPDSIVKQTYEAPIVVTGIKYSEDNLSHVLSDADYLEIPTRRRNFTISFAALDYTNSLDIEYAYKLDDNQWYYIGKKNSVSFVSLPAGKYQFQIKATNGDGIWMNSVKTVTLQVYFLFPTFAVIVVVPAFFAVTNPLLVTVATDFLPEDQLTFLLVPSIFSVCVSPTNMVSFFSLMAVFAFVAAFLRSPCKYTFASDLCSDGCGSGFFAVTTPFY